MGENNGAHRNPFCTYWLSRKRALCVSFRCVLGGFSRLFSILDYNFCTLDTASNSNRAVSNFVLVRKHSVKFWICKFR